MSAPASTAVLQSWVPVDSSSDFPIQNLPYGVFTTPTTPTPHIGVAIGKHILDLHTLAQYGLFAALPSVQHGEVFKAAALNAFMALPRAAWVETRALLTHLLADTTPTLRDNTHLRSLALVPQADATMQLPCVVGDYTDFYASKNHAYNLGCILRGEANALQPNYLHLPVGYHGRASSIVCSGTPVHRPRGQTAADDATPSLTACRVLDFELEVGTFLGGPPNPLGHPISLPSARDRLFGLVLLNDWSARDVQRWEYVPLGPFTAKNFATTISPWIVTFEALEPFRCAPLDQLHPAPLPYLTHACNSGYDVGLSVSIVSDQSVERVSPPAVTRSNTRHLYWTFQQQLTHHTVTGCNMRAGDLLGSGTISGPAQKGDMGSMIELSWKGAHDVPIGEEREGGGGGVRKFLRDGDEVCFRGRAEKEGLGYSIGFGECRGRILPAVDEKDWI